MPRRSARVAEDTAAGADAGAELEESEAVSTAGSDHAGSEVVLEGAGVVAAAAVSDEEGSEANSEQGAAEFEAAGDGQGWALLAAAAAYLALEQPAVNINEPVMAQALAQAPALAYQVPSQLMSLIVAQQGANDGAGGREHPITEVQLTAYLKGSTRLLHVPTLAFTKPPSLRPRAPAAQTELLQTLDPLCRYVGAYSQAHRSQEERTLLWIKYAFHGRCGNRFPRGFDGGPRVAFYQRNWSGVSTMADSV